MTPEMLIPKIGTKKFKVLEFIGYHQGVKYSQIQRFICKMNGLDYYAKRPALKYINGEIKEISIRKHTGIWSNNLTNGKKSILKQYCVKNSSNLWILNQQAAKMIATLSSCHKSVTSKNVPFESVLENCNDTVKKDSKVASVESIQIKMESSPILKKQDNAVDLEFITAVRDLDMLRIQEKQIAEQLAILQIKLLEIKIRKNELKKFISTKLDL